MPTEAAHLFLLAHQDDELGPALEILRARTRGERVICAYLTNGAWGLATPARRNAETLRALARLGVGAGDVVFLGDSTGIRPGQLATRITEADAVLTPLLDRVAPLSLHVHAWEGGHEDHDAACWLATHHVLRRAWLDRAWTFPLYTREGAGPIGFRALAPLAANGPIDESRATAAEALRLLALTSCYPSQPKAMLGLAPFLVRRALTRRHHRQRLDAERLRDRPHSGLLLYELRGRASYEPCRASLSSTFPLP